MSHAILRRTVGLLAAIVVAALAAPAIALAAAPANDGRSGATVISTLPFADTVDLTEATKDADDPTCDGASLPGAPFRTIWYHYAGGPTTLRIHIDAPGRPILFVMRSQPSCLYAGFGNSQTFEPRVETGMDLVFGLADDVPGTLSISITDITPDVPNDEWQNALSFDLPAISDPDGVPLFSDEVVLDKATDGPDDPTTCDGHPAHPHRTVWYRFRLGFEGTVSLHLATSYPEIHIGRRSGGTFHWLACTRNDVDELYTQFRASPHIWYYVLAAADLDDAGTMVVGATVDTLGIGSPGTTLPPTATIADVPATDGIPMAPIAALAGIVALALALRRRQRPHRHRH